VGAPGISPGERAMGSALPPSGPAAATAPGEGGLLAVLPPPGDGDGTDGVGCPGDSPWGAGTSPGPVAGGTVDGCVGSGLTLPERSQAEDVRANVRVRQDDSALNTGPETVRGRLLQREPEDLIVFISSFVDPRRRRTSFADRATVDPSIVLLHP
jgi:hypothetical protein